MSAYTPAAGWNPEGNLSDCFFVLSGRDIALNPDGHCLWEKQSWMQSVEAVQTGHIGKQSVAVIQLQEPPAGASVIDPRQFMASQSESLVGLYSHASQILRSRKDHKFCGRCGSACKPGAGEWAMTCSNCEMPYYPRISPCIIVLIHRGDEILLVQHKRHLRKTTMHTVVAGFIEPGETAEEAVVREIREEVGLEVKGVEYCFSQSWPFPHALMLGFRAEYSSGEILLEEEEIASAEWFNRKELPDLPPKFTISRHLIDY
ncbi:NAD(+) diphosphatase [Endozoicomonas arenosclerae]|uniref:NAD(+) diphosphatase n=1 Tax=Endozoicomonas arenosclerae TaxID=1633495 RepID=UPI0007809678|nr:NAD(+) diphosphatase [Endozoicomonas arenosclerae]